MRCPITGYECNQPKFYHITDIGEKGEIYCQDLCKQCFKYIDPSQDIVDEWIEPLKEENKEDFKPPVLINPIELIFGNKKCPKCNMTILDFNKLGKAGCPFCYTHFASELYPLISMYHGSIEHIGKKPKSHETKKSLQLKLEQAIKEERYEEAAKIKKQLSGEETQ